MTEATWIKCENPGRSYNACVVELDEKQTCGGMIGCSRADFLCHEKERILKGCMCAKEQTGPVKYEKQEENT